MENFVWLWFNGLLAFEDRKGWNLTEQACSEILIQLIQLSNYTQTHMHTHCIRLPVVGSSKWKVPNKLAPQSVDKWAWKVCVDSLWNGAWGDRAVFLYVFSPHFSEYSCKQLLHWQKRSYCIFSFSGKERDTVKERNIFSSIKSGSSWGSSFFFFFYPSFLIGWHFWHVYGYGCVCM